MKILALDSTAVTAAVALCDGEKLVASYTLNNMNTHSETLLPMIESTLKLSGWTTGDIELFACSAGPGSFTGVRIGAATIKGLAFAKDVPCIGVSTLEALAYNLKFCDGIVCPLMNARRGQVYNALFEGGERLCEDRAISAEELAKSLENETKNIWFCGDGVDLIKPFVEGKNNAKFAPETLLYPSGYSVAMVALKAYENGVSTTAEELAPTYLRMPQAERERLEREKTK